MHNVRHGGQLPGTRPDMHTFFSWRGATLASAHSPTRPDRAPLERYDPMPSAPRCVVVRNTDSHGRTHSKQQRESVAAAIKPHADSLWIVVTRRRARFRGLTLRFRSSWLYATFRPRGPDSSAAIWEGAPISPDAEGSSFGWFLVVQATGTLSAGDFLPGDSLALAMGCNASTCYPVLCTVCRVFFTW